MDGRFEVDLEKGIVRYYSHSMEDASAACAICVHRDDCDRDKFKKCAVWCG